MRRTLLMLCMLLALVAACGAPAPDPEPSPAARPVEDPAVPEATLSEVLAPSGISPSSPEPEPEPEPEPSPPPRERLVVHGTGDVNVDPSYIPALAQHGYHHAWAGLDGLFVDDDLTIINLECAVSDLGQPLPKEFNFRCDPAALPAMRESGVQVANLGNNHGRDYGEEALLDSRQNLLAHGIAPVGVGVDEAEAHQPELLEIKGWKIAVLGFGGVVPSSDWIAGPDHAGMADGDDAEGMAAAVRAAGEVADLVLVTVHWGAELDTHPRPEDIERATAMIDHGADAIFGHHAHRLQPLTWYRDRPIAWGLGNFVWPNFSAAGSRTAVAEVVVEPDGSIGACLIPAFIETPGQPVLTEGHAGPCAPTPGMDRPTLDAHR